MKPILIAAALLLIPAPQTTTLDEVFGPVNQLCRQPEYVKQHIRECGVIPPVDTSKTNRKPCAKEFCEQGDRLPSSGCYCVGDN